MEIKKAKTRKGVITIEHESSVSVGDETYTNKKTEENTIEPHPDFEKAIQELVPYMIDIFYWSDKEEHMQQFLSITGISVSGKDEKAGVVISAILETASKGVAINSPLIRFSENTYGWEEDLEDAIAAIKNEAQEYLNGKKAQLSIYDAIEQNTPEITSVSPDAQQPDEEDGHEENEQDTQEAETDNQNA